ncbi:MAG: carbohydrate kinase [Bacteroidetes bacterium]|nr:MAG: carbohydrate kinase [Bacteroidota bacterium]RLE00300.1 MAG: carbohydrate kinase [Bacteroidota bacterium]
MKQDRIKEILEKISKVKIAVYGDFCLDAYWLMDPEGSEISVETGLKAEAVASHKYSPGGAGNIVANLAALKPGAIKVIGVVGNDIYGRELSSQLQALGADTVSLTIQEEVFQTYTYTKKYYGDKEDPRIDFGLKNSRSAETDEALLGHIESALMNYDALIFNQQVSGSITHQKFIDGTNTLFEKFNDKIVVLDSRHFNSSFKNIHRKVNEIEIAVLNGLDLKPQDDVSISEVRKLGTAVYEQYEKPVFVTCGSRGIVCIDAEGITEIPGIQLSGKLDTVGAGDTTISALTLCLAAGISPAESAAFANHAAAVTVQKLFTTGTASGDEILQLNKEALYNHKPELAASLSRARYLPKSEIELVDENVLSKMGHIKHVLFDHDGTISTIREGWESVMEPMMIKAILGEKYEKAGKELHMQIREQVLEYIDRSTGIQTILQMEGLVEMVDAINVVPKEEILDKFGYKNIYNDALMEVVSIRLEKLGSGQLNMDDFTMVGSIGFLKALKERGIKLYLASGTDKQDVINEAEILGYAELFDGGIYGSENDIKKYTKKMIINRIIDENKLRGNELAVFGDGPVEIRECIHSGGIAVGVASDEIERSGLNEEKRSRLIRAGANLIIPDFSQTEKLLNLLFNK